MAELTITSVIRTGPFAPKRRWRQPLVPLLLALVVLACFVGPTFLPHAADQVNNSNPFAPPSWDHWFGTDEIGRDMFARVLVGGQISLSVSFGAVAVAFVVGTIWGTVAALRKGWADELLMRFADISMAVPQILFALLCVASFGASILSLILIIGLLLAPSTARMARATLLEELRLDYVAAARAYGASTPRVLLTEVLPNALPGLLAQTAINVASAMILEASLSFVGLGVPPPAMSWGVLMQQGYGQLFSHPLYIVWPAVAMLMTVLLLNLVADRGGNRSKEATQ
ncbi:ABC transporter permease [Microbacterium sp. NC79]|uniref:ABC transporter permease n=1 Tax=Microbacterium sp. NC79 TaxID=2851009 RepID=UPI001C2BB072|nr:ABC transporter permease [Microbacterium sp. NC79]MBV0896219.1 ABC transporter permease [Microbacterium sp. NC79]